jgi:biopolymer transport protein ExbB
MASGVAKATLPTMTGLVISISGLFAITYLEKLLDDKVTEYKFSVDALKHA